MGASGRLMLAGALLAALVDAPTAAQEPMRVCTELVDPEASPDTSPVPALQGRPADGDCDVVVYLPLVLADAGLVRELVTDPREEQEQAAREAVLDAMDCEELKARAESLTDELEAAVAWFDWAHRCEPG